MHARFLSLLAASLAVTPCRADVLKPPPQAPHTVLPPLVQAPPSEPGWQALEHFTGPDGRDDFYTAAPAERLAVTGALHYADRGAAGYLYAGAGGALPLYRWYSGPGLGTHFYSLSLADAPPGWAYEGVAGYLCHGGVMPPGVRAVTTAVTVYVLGAAPAAPQPPPAPAPAQAAPAQL